MSGLQLRQRSHAPRGRFWKLNNCLGPSCAKKTKNARIVLHIRVATNFKLSSKAICVMLLLCLLSHIWYCYSGRNEAKQCNFFRSFRTYSQILLHNCTLISFNIFKPKTGFPNTEALEWGHLYPSLCDVRLLKRNLSSPLRMFEP